MAFPAGWDRRCKLTVQADKVDAGLIDFPVLLDETTLPLEMLDAESSYPALLGGGDIRFSSDSAGSVQLACEIVTFITANGPGNGEAEIWVKLPSVASATDTDFYVWYHKSGEVQPAIDSTYGAENVWDSNYKMVQHMNENPDGTAGDIVDSTSNSNDGTSYGGMNQAAGKIGAGLQFDQTDDYVNCGLLDYFADSEITISVMLYPEAEGSYQRLINPISGGLEFAIWSDNRIRTYIQAASNTTVNVEVADYNLNEWLQIEFQYSKSAGKHTIFLNGLFYADIVNSGDIIDFNKDWYLGWRSFTQYYKGRMDEVRISNIARPAEWIKAKYTNQFAPATFVVEGIPESTSATYTLTVDAASYLTSYLDIGLLSSNKIYVSSISYSISFTDIGLLSSNKIDIDPASYLASYSDIGLLRPNGYTIAVDPASYLTSLTEIGLLSPNKIEVSPISYSLSLTEIGLLKSNRIDVSSASYSLIFKKIDLYSGKKSSISSFTSNPFTKNPWVTKSFVINPYGS